MKAAVFFFFFCENEVVLCEALIESYKDRYVCGCDYEGIENFWKKLTK